MKDLFLIRHAHAGPYLLPDECRRLSDRGIEEAKELKEIFSINNFPCGFWYISKTHRTKETAEIIMENIDCLGESLDEFWYHASGPDYVEKILSSVHSVVYLVAHNPSISYAASYFSGEMIQMETSSCIHFHWPLADAWNEISQGSAIVNYIH
jgi:phosphohistidine phosphatase SixA